MNMYIVLIGLLYFAGWLLLVFTRVKHRQQTVRIIEELGLDKDKTFYSTGGYKRILIFTFDPHALTVRLITNVLMPKLSLVDKQYIVPYNQIARADIGQGTTTFKLVNTISEEMAVMGYGSGSLVRPDEKQARSTFTSAETRKAFSELLAAHGVEVRDVTTSGKRALKIALITVAVFGSAGVLLWFYSLGWIF